MGWRRADEALLTDDGHGDAPSCESTVTSTSTSTSTLIHPEHAPSCSTTTRRAQLPSLLPLLSLLSLPALLSPPSLSGRAHDVAPAGLQVHVQVRSSQKSTPTPNQESVSLPALPIRHPPSAAHRHTHDRPAPSIFITPQPPKQASPMTAMAPLPPPTCPPHLTSLAATLALLHRRLPISNRPLSLRHP